MRVEWQPRRAPNEEPKKATATERRTGGGRLWQRRDGRACRAAGRCKRLLPRCRSLDIGRESEKAKRRFNLTLQLSDFFQDRVAGANRQLCRLQELLELLARGIEEQGARDFLRDDELGVDRFEFDRVYQPALERLS